MNPEKEELHSLLGSPRFRLSWSAVTPPPSAGGEGARRSEPTARRRGPRSRDASPRRAVDFVLTLADDDLELVAGGGGAPQDEASPGTLPAEALSVGPQVDAIVLTTDLSEESMLAFVPTAALARVLGKEIVLVHVVHTAGSNGRADAAGQDLLFSEDGAVTQDARTELAELAGLLGSTVRSVVLHGSDVAEEIVRYAQSIEAGFIAMACHGRSGLRDQEVGRVAQRVLLTAGMPVLCFPKT